ncbi:hypothetical protein BACCAP_03808 [Pseudoflavonifractor capillosus ATCC 29799]|uniref:Uncharacterized protein n=1 Tax=Pseudoflavonifractor capillosus ATCC 29799 TaxID=411467 RepID=A6P003_9FIRM|nr:hypothetical protein BACCAP_03808 [Pseudoflavonifractor capillosus ATCC 29799]
MYAERESVPGSDPLDMDALYESSVRQIAGDAIVAPRVRA